MELYSKANQLYAMIYYLLNMYLKKKERFVNRCNVHRKPAGGIPCPVTPQLHPVKEDLSLS